jgi:hypothetical protein
VKAADKLWYGAWKPFTHKSRREVTVQTCHFKFGGDFTKEEKSAFACEDNCYDNKDKLIGLQANYLPAVCGLKADSPCSQTTKEKCEHFADKLWYGSWKPITHKSRREAKVETCNFKFKSDFTDPQKESHACRDNCYKYDFSKDGNLQRVFCDDPCKVGNTKDQCVAAVNNVWGPYWKGGNTAENKANVADIVCNWTPVTGLTFKSDKCDPKECDNWTCKNWCKCFKAHPEIVELFEGPNPTAGEQTIRDSCPSDNDECDCTEFHFGNAKKEVAGPVGPPRCGSFTLESSKNVIGSCADAPGGSSDFGGCANDADCQSQCSAKADCMGYVAHPWGYMLKNYVGPKCFESRNEFTLHRCVTQE